MTGPESPEAITGNFEAASRSNPFFAQIEREERELIDPATGRLRAELARAVACPVCDADDAEPLIDERREEFEALICRLGMGYRIKLVAQRVEGSATT